MKLSHHQKCTKKTQKSTKSVHKALPKSDAP
jgi:hypothetical protein